ncbi:MAG: tRNA 2-thiocytidine biosynthesis TtcA family protein [Pseudomonadota bacterium]
MGLSGGKDSLTLLWTLKERLARIPVTYNLLGVYVDPGFGGNTGEALKAFCSDIHVPLVVSETDFGVVAHSEQNRENPCFLCSRRRRQRVFEIARERDFNIIAYGHHKDDIIETLFMNMCYAGEISAMMPRQSFFKGLVTIIRPLAFCEESQIRRFAADMDFPCIENPCPSAKTSKRHEIKTLLQQLYRSNPKIRGNLFRSMHHINSDYLPNTSPDDNDD